MEPAQKWSVERFGEPLVTNIMDRTLYSRQYIAHIHLHKVAPNKKTQAWWHYLMIGQVKSMHLYTEGHPWLMCALGGNVCLANISCVHSKAKFMVTVLISLYRYLICPIHFETGYSQCPNKSPGTFIKFWHFLVTGCPYYVQYFCPILMKIFTVLFIRYSIFAFLRPILYTGFLISSIFQVLGWELGHITFVNTWFVHPSFAVHNPIKLIF